MSEKTTTYEEHVDVDSQVELVKEIKTNIETLKSSVDQILNDMNYIRTARLEILDKFDGVKNDNLNSAHIQVTLGKAQRIMRKSEENRRKLELVLKKVNDFNFIHTFTTASDLMNSNITTNNDDKNHAGNDKKALININSGQEKIRLHLLGENKYMLTAAEVTHDKGDEFGKDKSDFKWGKDSALKELQWIVKMKLYKLRHHYDRLPYDQDLEERTPLPLSWRHA